MNNPKVSIIVPCYKQAEYLDEALQSVLDQSYQNWECIIIDDRSTDNSFEIIDNYIKKDFFGLFKRKNSLQEKYFFSHFFFNYRR